MKTLLVSVLLGCLSLGVAAQQAPAQGKKQVARAKPAAAPAVAPAPALVPMGPAELEIASQVHVGQVPCELGASVTVEAHPQVPGYFRLSLGKQQFLMSPLPTATGAVRLEDPHAGAVWLQIANKSMLLSSRLGKRLADECMSPAQVQVAEAMRRNPTPSLLDQVQPQPAAAVAGAQPAR